MKNFRVNLKMVFTILLLLVSLDSWPYSFKVNDLCYSITSSLSKTVEVTNEKSYGNGIPSYINIPSAVVIPSEVAYNDTTYSVTAIGSQAFRSCGNMKSVSIPEGIKTIGEMSFEACGGLSSLELPSTLTSISRYGIENCQGLQSIICKAAKPPICDSYALNLNIQLNTSHPTGTCVIYVPSNSVSVYKADSPWNSFTIEPISNEKTDTVLASSISINKDSLTLFDGETESLSAKILPDNVTNDSVTWQSSDTSVAKVDNNGLVSAANVGNAIIVATTVDGSNLSDSCIIIVEKVPSPVAVDLGLSVKWANCNIGAASPERYGKYFGWADPTSKKTSTDVNDYPSANHPSNISGTEYDMAKANWGSNWRLPTNEECQELKKKCTWTWQSVNGIVGMKITGPNGNSIFLPAAGKRVGNEYTEVTTIGNYWSGTLYDANRAWDIYLYQNGIYDCGYNLLYEGRTIRPVYVSTDTILASSITINKDSLTLFDGETESLSAKILPDNVTNDSVTWQSSDTSVAKVDNNGLVSAANVGKAIIIATTVDGSNLSDSCIIIVEKMPSPVAIDLGLSVKWASFNIGATSPEKYGGLYGWADATGSKTSTNINDYPSSTPPTEISGTEYDIAKAKWGGNWRLPTTDELSELNSKCTWAWTTVNGIKGKKATGPNGNSIFIPAAGNRKGTLFNEIGESCFLWGGNLLGGVYGEALHLHETDHFISYTDRYVGLSVRPVTTSVITGVVNNLINIKPIYHQVGNSLIFENLKENSSIKIFSIDGRLFNSAIASGDFELNISCLPSGIYVVRINNYSGKIVIK